MMNRELQQTKGLKFIVSMCKYRANVVVCALVLSFLAMVGCGADTTRASATPLATTTPPATTINITQGDQFAPFILQVTPGTTVTWNNLDFFPHTMHSTPQQSIFLNPALLNLTVASRGTTTFTFIKPGLYDYYDTKAATWSVQDLRVQADAGVPSYPEAMEGVVWVNGPIPGLPKTALNSVPNNHDDFVTDFLAVQPGGTVQWHNYDTDDHFIAPMTGWNGNINPDPAFQLATIHGSDAQPPDGASVTLTFTIPGLYYYYCTAHADVDSTWHRAMADTIASEYPIPMEGFVLVAPSS
jgi:plastocyanin